MVVLHPLGDLVGAGADGVLAAHAEVGDFSHGLGVHYGHGGAGELGNEAGVGLGQGDREVIVVGDGEALQAVYLPGLESLGPQDLQGYVVVDAAGGEQALKGILHVGSGEGAAVGEDHPFPQGEAVGQAVIGDAVVLNQAGDYLAGAVGLDLYLEEAVKDVHGHHVVVGGLGHVHGLDIVKGRCPEQALLHAGGGGSGGSLPGAVGGGGIAAGTAAGGQRKYQRKAQQQGQKLFHGTPP